MYGTGTNIRVTETFREQKKKKIKGNIQTEDGRWKNKKEEEEVAFLL